MSELIANCVLAFLIAFSITWMRGEISSLHFKLDQILNSLGVEQDESTD